MLHDAHGNGGVYVMPGLAELYQRDDTTLVKRIQAVFKGCGIDTRCTVKGYSRQGVDVGFHSLRHSFVSLSANAGASLAAVQAVVGHSNPAMTRHYLHADQNVVKNAVGLLPDVAHPNSASAATAKFEAILAGLEGLSKEELAKVGERVKEMMEK
jgi:hypothetical protein